MTGYSDYVLGLIPVALLGITFLLFEVGLSMQMAVPIGGGAAAALVAHAMFVRGPVAGTPQRVVDSPARSAGPEGGVPPQAD